MFKEMQMPIFLLLNTIIIVLLSVSLYMTKGELKEYKVQAADADIHNLRAVFYLAPEDHVIGTIAVFKNELRIIYRDDNRTDRFPVYKTHGEK